MLKLKYSWFGNFSSGIGLGLKGNKYYFLVALNIESTNCTNKVNHRNEGRL